MTTVIIAAHNEAALIGECLDSLRAGTEPGEFEVIVVANGCEDGTASVAAERLGVRVIELPIGNKALALNVGDSAASSFPRIYLDADIMVTSRYVAELKTALEEGSASLAAGPARRLDLSGRPILVRGYYAISSQLPAFRDGLFGRGMIALSENGRRRFGSFPDMIADDLYLDSLFASSEKRCLETVATTVATPRRTRDLVRRLVRVRRGNNGMRRASAEGGVPASVRPSDRSSWLTDVVLRRPRLYPAAIAYVGITVVAEVLARRGPRGSDSWGQDRSTRQESSASSRAGSVR
jgi:glycosyltransferase involved in cell wall biosynthesis